MASEDVIELGSSDDEAEPAPKKSKPMPNAMVCIPRKIHDVTIRPSKLNTAKAVPASKAVPTSKAVPASKAAPASKAVPAPKSYPSAKTVPTAKTLPKIKSLPTVKLPGGVSIVKGATSKEVTVVRAVPLARKKTTTIKAPSIVSNPFATKTVNGKPVLKNVMRPHLAMIKPIKIQKPATTSSIYYAKHKNLDTSNNSGISLNNLPSSITVKKTTKSKPIIFMKTANQIMKPQNSDQVNEVQTVELDDDEGSPTTSSPAWYLRPEEQTEENTLEQENNAEPETPAMIEITIEDSPIKPVLNKRTCEVGAELAITIDDSPVKATVDKNASPSGSDDEATITKEPNSKKKLNYPKEAENENRKTVEIEIDFPYEVSLETGSKEKEMVDDFQEVSIVSVQGPEPIKKNEGAETSTQKNNSTPPKENKIEIPSSSSTSEFHSVYQHFIDTCLQLENSEDMKIIVEKKIKAYYRQVPKEYAESEEFVDMVASKILAMKASPEKMYLYIKDIVDELNMQRKIAKSQILNTETKKEDPDQFAFKEDREFDSKRQRQIRKLEKTIKKLHRAIQKLEEQEVDFDDEDDSVYLLTERYKERMVRVYAKFCQLTNTKMPSEPRIVIDARPGQPSGPAKRLEKWINKKVPIGTPLPFPDFHDVLRCVRDANDEDKLGWNEADIMEEARDLFTRCGKKLQRRRQENEWRLAASRIALEVDPAENNEQLKCKLEANKKIAANKETEIFNKYADRQNQLKLEATEIGDKEAEESPVESEEEEANDESVSLENKGKRKERLKRLIQEISTNKGKENEPEVEAHIEKLENKEEKEAIKENDTKDAESKENDSNDAESKENDRKDAESKENDTKDAESKENDTKDAESKENDAKEIENKEASSEILKKILEKPKNDHDAAETLSVSSDDIDNVESDIDELHLLQKLHSSHYQEESSTFESSDSESPIAISDSMESDSDTNNKKQSDVISIENSSYSESEADNENGLERIDITITDQQLNNDTEAPVDGSADIVIPDSQPNNESEAPGVDDMEVGCSNVAETCHTNDPLDMETTNSNTEKVTNKSNNNENNEPVEDILLASSDEEIIGSQEGGPSSADSACINLGDDLISIDETVVGSVVEEPDKVVEKESRVIVTEGVSNAEESSVVENNTDSKHLKDDSKVTENTNESIFIESSQEIAPSASKEEISQNVINDEPKSADTVTYMDVDPTDDELKAISRLEDKLPPALCSETQ